MAQPRVHVIHGVVRDSAGAAVRDADVRAFAGDSIVALARTDSGGQFSLSTAVPAHRLEVRRLGYQKYETSVRGHRDDSIHVVLAEAAVALEGYDVLGRREEPGGWLREFYQRRRDNSFGRYFTREEIARSGKHQASELLRLTPGVTLTPSRRFGYTVRMRGCRYAPMIWLDGTRLPGAELDDVVKPDDVAGMEVYASSAGLPAQYLDRSNRGCGTILIWTRHQ